MRLQRICSGNVKVVPSGTAYDAAVFRELKEPTFSDTLKECKEQAGSKTKKKKQ